MKVSIVGNRTYWKYRSLVAQKIYPSRSAAFRAAKRYLKLPMSKHPDKLVYPYTDLGDAYDLDERNVRLYVFYTFVGAIILELHIREDKPVSYGDEHGKGDQLPHFNSGKHPGGKKDHRYWNNG